MNIIERYIPKTIDELIGLDYEKKVLIDYLKSDTNLILYGGNGTGKTLIKDLIIKHKKIEPKNIFIFNVDVYFKKDKINFLIDLVKSLTKKIIIIDSFQELTQDNQNILKSLIKNYTKNVSFILCINNNTHLNENLNQYFVNLILKKVKVADYKKYITNIFDGENIKVNDKIVNRIIYNSNNFHDINNNLMMLIINHNSGMDIIKNYLKILNMNDLLIINKIINICIDEPNLAIDYIDKLILNGISCENIFSSLIKYIHQIKIKSYEQKIFFIKTILTYEMKNNITYTQLLSLIIELCG